MASSSDVHLRIDWSVVASLDVNQDPWLCAPDIQIMRSVPETWQSLLRALCHKTASSALAPTGSAWTFPNGMPRSSISCVHCAEFEVRMEYLTVGDYDIDGGITVERKTYADFATSLIGGRLFTQAALLA